MRKKYDFSKGIRGPVLDTTGKEHVAILLDSEVYEYFGSLAEKRGRGYQGLIDAALRTAMDDEGDRLNGNTQVHESKRRKERFPLWLDSDVLSHYRTLARKQGADYEGLINTVLRDAMQSDCKPHNEKEPHEAAPGESGPAGQIDPARVLGQALTQRAGGLIVDHDHADHGGGAHNVQQSHGQSFVHMSLAPPTLMLDKNHN